jgi:hypothetical protein
MTPKAIADAIEIEIGIVGHPRQLRDAIELELLRGGKSAASAAEISDRMRSRVEKEIVRRSSELDFSILSMRGQSGELVHGASYIFPDDGHDKKASKRGRIYATDLLEKIQSLTYGEFESFGRSVLREIGCSTAKVTPHAGDQGIDFYGEITVGSLLKKPDNILNLMHETRLVIVGQAKRYIASGNTIGPNTVRELVGALSLSRTRTYSRDDIDLLDDVELQPFTPVLALLFTTGKITKGARQLAKRAGLIAYSGQELALFLADRGIGIVGSEGSAQFDAAAFEAWLE